MRFKFFVIPIYPYGNDHYYHEIIALAEGLKELGHEVWGNVNYWFEPEKGSYLIKKNESKDFDVAIYDFRYVKSFEHLLFREGYPNFDLKKIHVLVDRNDWISPIWHKNKHYRIFNLILAGHLLRNVKYPPNVRPWAMGLTNRIIKYIDKYFNPDAPYEKVIGYNFRVGHNLRGYLVSRFREVPCKYPLVECVTKGLGGALPHGDLLDKYYWKKTKWRHDPLYFKMLNEKLLFFTVGGYYQFKPIVYEPYSILDRLKRKPFYYLYKLYKYFNKDFSPFIFVFQWDSFRFWEVLYSRACPIHLDFDYWNFLLPENPVEGKHYLGIKKLDVESFVNRLNSLSEEQILEIGLEGRNWVLEKYSPLAQAQRFLSYLNEI